MRTIALFIVAVTCLQVQAQQFSLPLIFEDFAGNTDTVIVGVDPAATNGIDASLGEVDSIGLHWQNDFEVWVIDAGNMSSSAGDASAVPVFHTKKQIVPPSCDFTGIIKIGLKFPPEEMLPYKVYWDSSAFNDPCLDGSLLMTLVPFTFGYQADHAWEYMTRLQMGSSVETPGGAGFFYVFPPLWFEQDGEDIAALFLVLSDTASLPEISDVGTDNEHIIPLFIYPNPTTSLLNVKIPFQSASETTIMISSMTGQMIDIRDVQPFTQQISIDVSGLPSGMYLLTYSFDGASKVTTFIKD